MSDRTYNVLFLCTGNSARSILAEALLNRDGGDRFRAFSAGSFPKGQVHPAALELLNSLGFATDGLRSKSWDEFSEPNAPRIDFVFTVCDDAAGEVCPIWPGHPMTAHWGIEDPAKVAGAGQREAFERALHYLHNRISLFLALPIESIDGMTLQQHLDRIGREQAGANAMSPEAMLRRTRTEEIDALRAALVAAELPVDDIEEPGRLFFRLDDGAASAAWAGLELRGSDALVRSVVIGAQERGTGRGTRLVRELIDEASRLGISRLWLLTTSAAPFFARLGFGEVSRDVVPDAIRATREFRDICPSSATCMSLSLD